MNNKKGSGNKRNPKLIRFLIYYSCIILVTMFVFNIFLNPLRTNKISYSEFEEMGRQRKIEEVQISSDKIYLTVKEEGKTEDIYITEKIEDPDLINKLNQWGVKKYGAVPETKSPLAQFFVSWVLPIIFFMFIGRLLTSRMQKSMGGFGKSTAKEYNVENNTGITFDDVAGQEEAKNSLQEIVDYLHNPRKYKEIGAKLPKGELLVGPPGTGKTLLAKAVAGEAKVPFFSISGSEFVQMFVGMGAARVRDLFNQAKKKAPCIIFIDEIDAIGKSRDTRISGGNDEREQTLNQLLTEMDGFDSSENPVIVLAATNRPDVLDKALLRPGRFDRRVIVSKPDLMGRKKILEVHIKNVKLADDVDLDSIARITSGSSGADLANIVNEAALRAVRNGRKEVTQRDLEEAMEVVFAGEAKKDRIMSKTERALVAYHEAGHALAGALQKSTDPVAKITIVPTTMGALGYTLQLPTEEKYLVSKDELEERIVVMLAGRAAEEVKFSQITTGASNDIEKATQLARNMVTIYGMSDKFDMMGLENASNRYIDGSPIKNYGTETGKEIDEEVLSIIRDSHQKAKKLLIDNRELLEKVAKLLLEKETISGEEFYRIVNENS